MSLTGLHTSANYQDELHQFMKKVEELVLTPYFDSVGKATIGIGVNIDDGGAASKYLGYVLTEMGINPKTPSEIDPTKTAIDVIAAAIDLISPKNSTTNSALQTILNETLRINFPTLLGSNATFSLTETRAYNVLDKIVADKKTALDAKLTSYGIDVAAMQNTKEYLVLTSLNYNTKQGATNLIGPKLLSALANDNRAEAWYEIRYGSNSDGQHASRRYSESDLFGLYDTAGATSEAEAKEIMRMYTRHQIQETDVTKTIQYYEQQYSPSTSGTNTITNNILPAYNYLVTTFAPGQTIDNVIVGAGLDSYAKIDKGSDDAILGTDKNDLIFGEKGDDVLNGGAGNDIIYGGEGNDIIYGGLGNDTLYGESGNDIYIINTGEGTDTIEDKQGDNKIIVNGEIIKLLIRQADGTYKTPDGRGGENNFIIERRAA